MSALRNVWSVQIENTAYCNRRCPWCPQSQLEFSSEQRMPWPVLERITAELVAVKYKGRLHPYGNGEPLTDPQLIDRLRYLANELPECFMFISTNGDFINKSYTFADLLMAGVNEIQCNHYDDNNQELKAESPAQVVHYDIGMLRPEFYNRAGNINLTNISPAGSCWFPGKKLYFNWRGDMLICCSDWQSKYPLGNIMDKSIRDMVESPMMQEYQTKMERGRPGDLPLCAQCNLISHRGIL